MKTYFFKIKNVLFPAVRVMTLSVVIFGLLRWLFTFGINLRFIKADYWLIILPIVISVVSFFIFLRKPFRVMSELSSLKIKTRLMLQVITCLAMAVMLMFTQRYVFTSFTSFQKVETAEVIESNKLDEFYEIDNFSVDTQKMGIMTNNRIETTRRTKSLSLSFYAVAAFENSPNKWYGVQYHKTSNVGTDSENTHQVERFMKECENKLRKIDFYSTNVFRRTEDSFNRDYFIDAVRSADNAEINAKDIVILEPHKGSYEDKSGVNLSWIFKTMAIWLCLMLILLSFFPVDKVLDEEESDKAA